MRLGNFRFSPPLSGSGLRSYGLYYHCHSWTVLVGGGNHLKSNPEPRLINPLPLIGVIMGNRRVMEKKVETTIV